MLVYEKYECFVMHMLYVCVLYTTCGSSQCCILHDLQFVNAGRGCKRRPYGIGILHSRSHDCLIGALVYVFVGFWDGDYVSQLPYVWYYVGVKSSFQHAREECESKMTYVF